MAQSVFTSKMLYNQYDLHADGKVIDSSFILMSYHQILVCQVLLIKSTYGNILSLLQLA